MFTTKVCVITIAVFNCENYTECGGGLNIFSRIYLESNLYEQKTFLLKQKQSTFYIIIQFL
ncbi:hypothetical protein KL86DYS2_11849 [uncultured Dysgonomonas sp.]|uniref:Uncharacterized protein n=1 Tax=uncultured Dysgonomonas sp. TaxID=206096 RepID=A0A212JM88_9BACT|nr:hypothetical protein KL86DYS2_11849 [uncultured Dysgonomonas sp.]